VNSVFALRHRPLHPAIQQRSASRDPKHYCIGPR
jgi:hypothetical protein